MGLVDESGSPYAPKGTIFSRDGFSLPNPAYSSAAMSFPENHQAILRTKKIVIPSPHECDFKTTKHLNPKNLHTNDNDTTNHDLFHAVKPVITELIPDCTITPNQTVFSNPSLHPLLITSTTLPEVV